MTKLNLRMMWLHLIAFKQMNFSDNRPPWLTNEFFSVANERDIAQAKSERTKNEADKKEYRRLRNKVTEFKRCLKKEYFQTALNQAGRNSQKLWKVIKQLFRKGKNSQVFIEINGKYDHKEMADEINRYFCEIGPNLADKIPDSLLKADYKANDNLSVFELSTTDEMEVRELLNNIPDNKATGKDGICVKFLTANMEVATKLLTYIINLSISKKVVPLGWKIAVVTPLFKDGIKSDPCNYRPVSILPAPSKILERVVHRQIYKHLSENKILSDAQFGFRRGYSTSTCILNLIDNIYRNMDCGRLTRVLFLDLKKAFNTVNHEILLNKLHMHGVSLNALDWFKSYLTNRVQVTRVKRSYRMRVKSLVVCPRGLFWDH